MAVCGGWPRSKGYGRYGAHSQGHSQGHGSWGWRSGGQFSSASSMQETLTMCLAERLLSKDRAKRRPSRSPSPLSSDGSDKCRGKTARRSALSSTERAELSELREFKAKHDAELAAKHTIELAEKMEQSRQKELADLEERILQAIPRPSVDSQPSSSATSSSKQKKLVEALLEDTIALSDSFSWTEVASKVGDLKSEELKDLMALRKLAPIPRGKAARVTAVVAFLKNQCRA